MRDYIYGKIYYGGRWDITIVMPIIDDKKEIRVSSTQS